MYKTFESGKSQGDSDAKRSEKKVMMMIGTGLVLIVVLLMGNVLVGRPNKEGSVGSTFMAQTPATETLTQDAQKRMGHAHMAHMEPKEYTEYFMFPDMVKPSEHEEEIFARGSTQKVDEDGFYKRSIRVTGAQGMVLNVDYKGRYQEGLHVHTLEGDDDLVKFGCTDKDMVLEYRNEAKARAVRRKLMAALADDKVQKVILSGRQIQRCPKSAEPEELLKAHEFAEDFVPKETRIAQSLRRVNVVVAIGDGEYSEHDGKWVRVKTSYANLQDVFEDLEFSGYTDMVERDSKLRDEKFKLKEDNIDGVPYDVAQSEEFGRREYGGVRMDHPLADGEGKQKKRATEQQERRLLWRWFKRAVSWVVDKVVKPVVNFVKEAVTTVTSFVKSVVGTIIQPVLKFVGSIVPVLVNKQGRHDAGTTVSLNYNSATGRAARVWEIDTKGVVMGPYFSVGDETDISILVAGKIACTNCFFRFYDGVFSWHIQIGGSELGLLELIFSTKVEAMLEVDVDITIITQVTQGLGSYPIPFLSVPVGPVMVGFALEPEVSIGVQIDVKGLYYKYHLTGFQKFGVRASLVNGVKTIRDGYLHDDSVGPLVREGVKFSVYMLPLVGLVFVDMAAVEAGVQPTLSFEMKPPTTAGCVMDWAIAFDCPLVVGAWIGIKTNFGMWRLAGFSYAISVIPSIPILDGCLAQSDVDSIIAKSGVVFGNIATAAAQGVGRLSAVTAMESEFRAASNTITPRYPLLPDFGEDLLEWVTGDGKTCPNACAAADVNLRAMESSPQSYICAVHLNNEGWFVAWQRGGASCRGALHSVSHLKSSYKCLCRESSVALNVDYFWKTPQGHDCGATCENLLMAGATSGNIGAAEVSYVCRAHQSGYVLSGFNIGPNHHIYDDKCGIGFGSQEYRHEQPNYECLCFKPNKKWLKPPVEWIARQDLTEVTGCPAICEREGAFPVYSGTKSGVDYAVCAPFSNSIPGWMAVRSVDGEEETSACNLWKSTSGITEYSGGYWCLCQRDSDDVRWFEGTTGAGARCTTVCGNYRLHPVSGPRNNNYEVCADWSLTENAFVGGHTMSSLSNNAYTCNLALREPQSRFRCACAFDPHI